MSIVNQLFITGISTDVGKTVVSAILSEAMQANYWKPIQAGELENSDSFKIKKFCTDKVRVLPEQFLLSEALSPHAAAELDGILIELNDFKLPKVDGNLLIEGAGGLLVPINSKGELIIDLVKKMQWPVLLVSRHVLGSINHTLLSLEALKNRNIQIAGIVFVGDENKSTESIIALNCSAEIWGRIPLTDEVSVQFIQDQAAIWKENKFLQKFMNIKQ